MSSVQDKVAIITGSSRGIGKALAIALVEKDAKVVLNGRNKERLLETQKELKEQGIDCLAVAGDISSYESCCLIVNRTIEHYGRLDILINNAGLSAEGRIEETKPEVFKTVFETNILGVINPTKAAIPALRESKGSIVFIGSIAGFMGLPDFSSYSASKMALTALVQSLRIELTGSEIHIGINYVGFAENDNEKTFINKDGEIRKMPVRQGFRKMPMKKVAAKIISGIEKKKKRQVFSTMGKVITLVQRYFPGIFEWIMIRRYKNVQGRIN